MWSIVVFPQAVGLMNFSSPTIRRSFPAWLISCSPRNLLSPVELMIGPLCSSSSPAEVSICCIPQFVTYWLNPWYLGTYIWSPDPQLHLFVLHNCDSFSPVWVRSDYLCLGIGLFHNLQEESNDYWESGGLWFVPAGHSIPNNLHDSPFKFYLLNPQRSCIVW